MEYKSKLPDEYLKFGAYFKSKNDCSTQYLIEFCEVKSKCNALVKIYTTDILENHFNTDGLANGDIIGIPEDSIEWVAEVDLYGKYFFPKFKNDLQLYYDDEKYYKQSYKSNSITSLFESINFAIELGLNKSGIVPY